jgi:RNA polymerase sigma factor (sigma-70 family)
MMSREKTRALAWVLPADEETLRKEAPRRQPRPRTAPKSLSQQRRSKRRFGRLPLTNRQQRLAFVYMPLARALAKPFKEAWENEGDEFDSAAYLALVEAAQAYEPTRNVPFATFARCRILGELRDVQRRLIVPGYEGDLEDAPQMLPIHPTIEEYGRVLGAEPDPPVDEELETNEILEQSLRKLPSRHARACREVFLNTKTQIVAAQTVGCSKSWMSRLCRESLTMLNDYARSEKPSPEEHGEVDEDGNRAGDNAAGTGLQHPGDDRG